MPHYTTQEIKLESLLEAIFRTSGHLWMSVQSLCLFSLTCPLPGTQQIANKMWTGRHLQSGPYQVR